MRTVFLDVCIGTSQYRTMHVRIGGRQKLGAIACSGFCCTAV